MVEGTTMMTIEVALEAVSNHFAFFLYFSPCSSCLVCVCIM